VLGEVSLDGTRASSVEAGRRGTRHVESPMTAAVRKPDSSSLLVGNRICHRSATVASPES
jgi:hypothetical protein